MSSRRRPMPSLAPLAFVLAGCGQVRYTEAFDPEGPVNRIEIFVDAGVVELVPGDKLRVERAVRAPEGTLALSHEVADGVLELVARCTTIVPCAVDTTVTVPAGVDVHVEVGDGEVWATGIDNLDVQLGDGYADLDVGGTLVAQVGSGSVRASVAPDERARIAVGDGDIEVSVTESGWSLQATALHVMLDGVVDVPSAKGRLELTAPGGDVVVQARKALVQAR